MDENLEFILDRVIRHDQEREPYKQLADKWVQMFKLDPGFNKPLREAIAKGMEQVILPTPYNVVNLSQRLLSSTPRIDVIPEDVNNQESEQNAEQTEKWLTAMWKAIARQQRRNVLTDNVWYSLVMGRHVFEVKWIKDNLPSLHRNKAFPISIRGLNPKDVGIQQGPYGTEFAYHKYDSPIRDVLRRYPFLRDAQGGTRLRAVLDQMNGDKDAAAEEHMVCVIDYWAMEEDGSIWNAILVEDEFAKEYKVTTYPLIPFIAGSGDHAVGIGDEFDGLSILHSIDGLWQYQCRLASGMATALLWYFWPHILISNENNTPVEDFEILPGGQDQVPPGTKVEQITINPNVPLAQAVYDTLDRYIQQSTYPDSLFGQAPAELKAGYAVALLNDAAQGRIKSFQEGLEMSLMHVHELVLALVEKKGGKKGVSIYGVDEVSGDKYKLTLSKAEINGCYHNEVKITPAMPTDDLSMVVQGSQLADKKYISSSTLRDKWLGIKTPTDETLKIALEEAMQSDEMRPYRLRTAMERYFGAEDALQIMWESKALDLMPPLEEGYEWATGANGRVEMRKMALPPTEEMPPPGGLPMDGGLPPPPGDMGAPPGVLPPGGPPLQGPGLPGPMGSAAPPVLTGQIEGESLGLDPSTDPLLMDMILNQQESPADQMMQTLGIQP